MRILLTNDDGIRAPGIEALYMAVADPENRFGGPLGELVWPVAPETVQSATSHGVTFHTPLMVKDTEVSEHMKGVAVDGRPADCVKLAVCSLWPEKFGKGERPDLILSGINSGANVGINVIYSGTVAAALEGAFLGVPSIALSLHLAGHSPRYDIAAMHARRTIEKILEHGLGEGGSLKPHRCLNVNIPVCDGGKSLPATPEEPEVVVCPMNTHGLVDAYERRVSPGGDVYYWASGSGFEFRDADSGTDVDLLFDRKITVTPLRYDLTEQAHIDEWRGLLNS